MERDTHSQDMNAMSREQLHHGLKYWKEQYEQAERNNEPYIARESRAMVTIYQRIIDEDEADTASTHSVTDT